MQQAARSDVFAAANGAEAPVLSQRTFWALTLGAIGVVYGDIGTSPLYAMKQSFFGPHGIAATRENTLGVLSLIFW